MPRRPPLPLVVGVAVLAVGMVAGIVALRSDGDGSSPTSIVLRAGDLGGDWTEEGEISTDRFGENEHELTNCLRVPAIVPLATAWSRDHLHGRDVVVATVSRWATAEEARTQAEHFSHSRLGKCIAAMFDRTYAEKQTVVDRNATTAELSSVADMPGAARTRLRYRFTRPSGKAHMWFDVVGMAREDVTLRVLAISGSEEPPSDRVEARALQAMLARL